MMKHLPILVLFGAIYAALAVCCTPDVSWSSQNIDAFDFLYSTSTFNVLHAPGAPLYVALGWLATRLPGNDASSLAYFLSVIPTMITCGLIFYIVRKKTLSALAPYLATIAFAGSQIAFSQAIIPEIYSLQCMLLILTYVLFEKEKTKLALVSLGLAVCVSWGALVLVPIFAWRYWKQVKPLRYAALVGAVPLLLYLYIPVANRPPHLSMGPTGVYELVGYFTYHPGTLLNLPAWEFPQRVGESVALLLSSLGVCAILAILALRRLELRTLMWLCVPGVAFYLTTRGPDAFVQLIPTIAFASIAVGYFVPRVSRRVIVLAACVSFLLLGLNTHNYDIGRTLDPAPTAASQMLVQLNQVPDDSWVVAVHDPSYAGIYYYNLKTGKNLKGVHPLFTDLDNAQWWEKDRIDGLVMPEIPYEGNYDPQHVSMWSTLATAQLRDANPDSTVWTVTYAGDRTRLEAGLTDGTKAPLVARSGYYNGTALWEYVTVYPYAYRYISGGYMMDTEWRTGTSTNMTAGLLGILLAFGGVIGYYLPKKVFVRLPKRRQTLLTMCVTAVLAMILCYILSLAGVPGFRFG